MVLNDYIILKIINTSNDTENIDLDLTTVYGDHLVQVFSDVDLESELNEFNFKIDSKTEKTISIKG